MAFIRVKKDWEISENQITPKSLYLNRRRFLRNLITVGAAGSILPGLTACGINTTGEIEVQELPTIDNFQANPRFNRNNLQLTPEYLATTYNNYYEFGGSKNIWENAQNLPTENWRVEVTGLVKKPRVYDLDDLQKKFPIEERIYRFRCVEAWAMVIPWLGFPMRLILEAVEPKSEAKFVRFSSYYNPQITKGPGFWADGYPWPYNEGLRIEEMANDLAFFSVGMYGKLLPKQNGAPIRQVIPWKYGFKGAKSIVKIEFLASQPPTFWNTLVPSEYDFEANVNPTKPHPRWSQATERIVGTGSSFIWQTQATLPYNGYGEYVGNIYR